MAGVSGSGQRDLAVTTLPFDHVRCTGCGGLVEVTTDGGRLVETVEGEPHECVGDERRAPRVRVAAGARAAYEASRDRVRELGYKPGAVRWQAFWEGHRARARGTREEECPYVDGSRKRKPWLHGWGHPVGRMPPRPRGKWRRKLAPKAEREARDLKVVEMRRAGRTLREIGEEVGLHVSTVCKIAKGAGL